VQPAWLLVCLGARLHCRLLLTYDNYLVRGDVRIAIGWASPCKFIEADSMLTVMSMVVQRGFPLKLSVTVDFQRSSPEVASLFAGIFV
jgi:hypothetical protein